MTFHEAMHNDATVNRMIKAGCTAQDIIGQLAGEKAEYLKRIIELDNIRPRKLTLPGGKQMVWQCPHELIPE